LGINRNTLHKKLSEFRLDDATTAAGSPAIPENGDGNGRDDDEAERLETPSQPRPGTGAGAGVPVPPVEEV